MIVAGWLHRQQASVIDYHIAESRLLRGRLGNRRIIFTDPERCHLAAKAKAVTYGAARAWHDRYARNIVALASRTRGPRVAFHRAPPTGPTADEGGDCGVGRADGD
jgi:hypothetical protein